MQSSGMPYVCRDTTGAIASLHRATSALATEYLPDQHPEISAFIGRSDSAEQFARLDADFVRVLEDVIDTLISKNILNITDLPVEAQAKLFSRKNYREHRAAHALHLFDDGEISSFLDRPPASV